jgi:hypothetical protein
MIKHFIFLFSLVIISQGAVLAQRDSLSAKDSAYTPARTSPFNMDERDKYGQRYTSARTSTDEKNCLKYNFGLFARGIAGIEYEREFANTWTFQGGLGTTIFRDYLNELWLEEEGIYSGASPVTDGNGVHVSGEVRYHFDDVFDDFFVGLGGRYTSYPLKYDVGGATRNPHFNEENLDVISNIGWGSTLYSGFYYEMLFGAGFRQVSTTNFVYTSNYVTTGNYTTTVNVYKTEPGDYLRPIFIFSLKLGGIF